MQTELAQLISLTSYGNEYLKTGNIPENYYPGNSIFQFCNVVDFRNREKKWYSTTLIETITAEDPLIWFKNLKNEGCTKLRLYYKPSTDTTFGPEYNLAGFSGGAGTWLIETIFDSFSRYWQKHWQVTNQLSPDNKIWAVNYAGNVQKAITTNQQLDITSITSRFKNVLRDLVEFCDKQNLQDWKGTFEKASNVLSSHTPNKEYYHHELIVTKNYSLATQQLLFAVAQSWVFGGMGWWNDMGFKNKRVNEDFLRLSQRLYDLLLQGIVGATNSF
jgi:hypothetical protein